MGRGQAAHAKRAGTLKLTGGIAVSFRSMRYKPARGGMVCHGISKMGEPVGAELARDGGGSVGIQVG
ncbi:hypothetical protein EMIT043CA1_200045 [Pseudomonas brassicacearum]